MKKVYLFGAGGHAKVVLDILQSNDIMVEEVFDDNKTMDSFMGIPVSQVAKSPLIISVGNNAIRKKIVTDFKDMRYDKAISKNALVSETVLIGDGTVVMQGAVIQSSVKIGKHAIINTSATVDHDCIIHDFAHIAPGANLCGGVEIGEGTLIGAGSVAIPGVKVGKWCNIGAGSVITSDIPDNVIAVGIPCKVIKYLDKDE